MASYRKAKLNDNSAFLQFNWKADVVESWIGACNFSSYHCHRDKKREILVKCNLSCSTVAFWSSCCFEVKSEIWSKHCNSTFS